MQNLSYFLHVFCSSLMRNHNLINKIQPPAMENKLGVVFQVRSHVPGYSGYVPGARSENIYGKTYGKVTEESSKRQEASPGSRFTTTNLGNSYTIRDQLIKSASKEKQFWKEGSNLHAFEGSNRSKKSKPRPEKFQPEVLTHITYEQAIGKST